ncbi:MAG TPA: hypothetical protein VFL54_06395 [Gammaproteobacteria bacterium]|nr:hypothetical protein [Gammaproteobacteria bacterium]
MELPAAAATLSPPPAPADSDDAGRRLPVRCCEAATVAPLDDWRLASERVRAYLARLDLDPGEVRELAEAAIAAAAREPAWASGEGAVTLVMDALTAMLARRAEPTPTGAATPTAASAIWRLRNWLAAGKHPVPETALETDAAGHLRFAAMPPIRRINMAPVKIDRRPAPWRWLGRLWGAG